MEAVPSLPLPGLLLESTAKVTSKTQAMSSRTPSKYL